LTTIIIPAVTKRIELNNIKFQKNCIDVVEVKLSSISELFDAFHSTPIREHLPVITEKYTDLCLFLVKLKTIYSKIEVSKFQDLCNEFTDMLYSNQDEKLGDYKADFLINKIRIIEFLYEHAIYKELNILSQKLYKLTS